MADVDETQLPGMGLRYDFTTEDGDRVGVLVHRTGRRDVFLYSRDDPDECRATITLRPDDARTLAELLGASRVAEHLAAVQQQVAGLTPRLDPGVAVVGVGRARPCARRRCTPTTGASIVAILDGDDVTAAPGADDVLVAGRAGRRHRHRRQARGAHREAHRALIRWCSGRRRRTSPLRSSSSARSSSASRCSRGCRTASASARSRPTSSRASCSARAGSSDRGCRRTSSTSPPRSASCCSCSPSASSTPRRSSPTARAAAGSAASSTSSSTRSPASCARSRSGGASRRRSCSAASPTSRRRA